jgi:hypothetical protein
MWCRVLRRGEKLLPHYLVARKSLRDLGCRRFEGEGGAHPILAHHRAKSAQIVLGSALLRSIAP